jgi:hypothetical protein
MVSKAVGMWLCLAPVQDPAPLPERTVEAVELRLTSGWSVTGRLVESNARGVEVEVDGLGSVTFPRSQIAGLRPVAAASRPASRPAADGTGTWPTRDEWFVLHGPEGKRLGTLHLLQSIAKDDAGADCLRIETEWRIAVGDRPEQITQVEEADLTGRARRLYYREVTVDADRSRARRERIVTATVAESHLAVTETTHLGRVPRDLPFTGAMTFPLLFEERARGAGQALAAQVFDPREAECVGRTAEFPGARRVLTRGEPEAVQRLRYSRGAESDEEWLDSRGRILRREFHGVWFVARAATAAEAQATAASDALVTASQLRTEPQGRFRMLLPNPGWRFLSEPGQAVVLAQEPVLGVEARAESLDQLNPGATAPTALDAAVRSVRLRLGLDHQSAPLRPLGDLPAGGLGVELRHRGTDPRRAGVETDLWTRVRVLPAAGGWVALCESGPMASQAEAEPDLQRVLRLFEPERANAVDASARNR